MNRLGTWLAASLCALALGGCGGGEETPNQSAALPAAVAEDLASQSEAIAEAHESDDVCAAAQQADELLAAVREEIAAGTVPAALREELEGTAVELVNEINCPRDGDGDEGKDGQGKGKDKGKGKDATTTTATTTSTTTGTTTAVDD